MEGREGLRCCGGKRMGSACASDGSGLSKEERVKDMAATVACYVASVVGGVAIIRRLPAIAIGGMSDGRDSGRVAARE